MKGVFVCYRRFDSAAYAGRIADYFARHSPTLHVFMDIAGIQPGDDFEEVIRLRLAETDVVLALIGDRWLLASAADGSRRIDDPNDVLRRELAIALADKRRIIPILLDGAEMPKASSLPEEIAGITKRSGYPIRHERFAEDMGKLADFIGSLPPESRLSQRVNPARPEVGADVIARLEESFQHLIDIDTPEAFLIIADDQERFVQFTGANKTDVLVDLPSVGLSERQLAAANQLFLDKFGAVEKNAFSKKDFSFNMRAPASAQALARLTIEVFQRVYGVTPNRPLRTEYGR